MAEPDGRTRGPEEASALVTPDVRIVRVVVLVSAAVAVLVYARQLFLGDTFALRDFHQYTWPSRQVLVDAIRAGRVPEWNGGIGFGTPFAAMPTNGVAYPPQWLSALFPLPLGIHVVMALHLLVGGAGTGLLARRLGAGALGAALAAGTLMTSGYVSANAVNGTYQSIAWVPWVAWAADRLASTGTGPPASGAWPWMARTFALAAVLALQILSGDPSSTVTAGLIAVALTLARSDNRPRAIARLALAAVGALLLAAAAVAPSLTLLGETSRTRDDALQWSMHPWRLAELLWPDALGDPIDPAANLARAVADSGNGNMEPRWSYSVFVGGPVLALAFAAVFRDGSLRWVLAASLLMVALAMGRFSPLYVAYRGAFPVERVLHFPEKHLLGSVVLWCALAGAGFTWLRESLDRRTEARAGGAPREALAARFVAGACAPTGALVIAFFALRPLLNAPLFAATAAVQHAPSVDLRQALAHMLIRGAVAFAVAAVAAALLTARPPWMAAAGAALVIGHAAWLGLRITPVVDASRTRGVPALLAGVPPTGPYGIPKRLLRSTGVEWETWAERMSPQAAAAYTHNTAAVNVASRFGFAAVPGYEGFRSVTLDALLGAARTAPISVGGFAALYGIDYVALPSGDASRTFLPVAKATERWTLLAVPGARPRAFVAQRWTWAPHADAVAAAFTPGRDRDLASVVVSGAPDASPPVAPAEEPVGPCAVSRPVPEDFHLDCWSPYGGFVVLAEEWMPGWTASVDGAPAPIARVDLVFQGVRVGPGRHAIRFVYRTPLLRAGAAVSLLSWLALGAFLLVAARRRRAARGERDSSAEASRSSKIERARAGGA